MYGTQIIDLLIEERDRIVTAINILQQGVPPSFAGTAPVIEVVADPTPPPPPPAPASTRGWTPERRARQSEIMHAAKMKKAEALAKEAKKAARAAREEAKQYY